MFSFIRTVVSYVLLLLFRWKTYDTFVKSVIQYCRRRHVRVNLPGLPDALDEVTRLPDGVADDLEFVGFDPSGCWLSCRTERLPHKQGTHICRQVLLEVPDIGTFRYNNVTVTDDISGTEQTSARLSLIVGNAMRHWKVQFNGALERVGEDDTDEQIHGVISLYWQCLSDPYSDWATPTTWQLARSVSRDGLRRLWDRMFHNTSVYYEQWGELWGRIYIEGHGERNVRLRSYKRRQLCQAVAERDAKARVSTHLVMDVKRVQLMYTSSLPGSNSSDSFGFVTYPVSASRLTDVTYDACTTEEKPTAVTLSSSRKSYKLELLARKHCIFDHGDENENHTNFCTFDLNGRMCCGIETVRNLNSTLLDACDADNRQAFKPSNKYDDETVVVSLAEHNSTNVMMCGGKGASLGVLTQSGFRVPTGICVTVNAFQNQLQDNPLLRKAMHRINNYNVSHTETPLQSACDDAVRLCLESDVREDIKAAVDAALVTLFGPALENIPLAVRSSAVGEDGGESSSAGQLETSLGVRGLEQIYVAIRKCWASSLDYRVVEYRRQNGQPPTEPTAVVIQQMVASDTAGVLFTNDPTTGNPCEMVLSAAPGLGESVVSGTVNPDAFRLRRNKNGLTITDTVVGDKSSRLVMNPVGGMQQVANTERQIAATSLTDEQALRICQTGLEIETVYGVPQDIEWAIHDGELYILQSRAITNIVTEIDEDIIHEFESPIASDEMYTTVRGDVFPEIITPLTSTEMCFGTDMAGKNMCSVVTDTYIPRFPAVMMPPYMGRWFANISCLDYVGTALMGDKCQMELNVLGQVIAENTNEKVLGCFGEDQPSSLRRLTLFLSLIIKSKRYTKNYTAFWDRAVDITYPNDMSLDELYDKVDHSLILLKNTCHSYAFMAQESIKWAGVLTKLLTGNEQLDELPRRINADLALLLADCPDVISADVPGALERLTKLIANSDIKDQFANSPTNKCHDVLLIGNDSAVKESYERFLELHGHRGYMELDFGRKSWAMDPEPLMQLLQQSMRCDKRETKQKDVTGVNEAVDGIETKLSPVVKYLMKRFFVPYARTGVAMREIGKSTMIKVLDAVKRGYWKLAEQMVHEGRLPSENLLFYFTHPEIGKLIETRSVSLIRKAKRRMKIAKLQAVIEYPTLCIGQPIPIVREIPQLPASCTLTGMPVCRGRIQGRARVLVTLSQAHTLEDGEILVCPMTDIGWSPCFPLISGLVTEIGGLISHGAVIAREYGIPCVVAVSGATQVFKSGDTLVVDGTAGTVQLINN